MRTTRRIPRLATALAMALALTCPLAGAADDWAPPARAKGSAGARIPSRRIERTTSLQWMSDVAARLAILEIHAGERAARAKLAGRGQPPAPTTAEARP